jgi:hypothetical protein
MPSTNGHGSGEAAGRVGLCLRVSSEEQRDRETIEIQRDFLMEYCRLYGLEVAGVYADDGVSGTIPLHERPEGRRLLEDARSGVFITLLVYRLDRLGRSLLVIVDAHDRLQDVGVSLRSPPSPSTPPPLREDSSSRCLPRSPSTSARPSESERGPVYTAPSGKASTLGAYPTAMT